jgi:hypothetical protein
MIGRQRLEQARNHDEHSVGVAHDFVVGEAQDPETSPPEVVIAKIVVGTSNVAPVRLPVDLHD